MKTLKMIKIVSKAFSTLYEKGYFKFFFFYFSESVFLHFGTRLILTKEIQFNLLPGLLRNMLLQYSIKSSFNLSLNKTFF